MNTNREVDTIKQILTESDNKKLLNEVSGKALSWALPIIGGAVYKGAKSAYDEFLAPTKPQPEKSYWQSAKDTIDSITSPVETMQNAVIEPVKNIAADALEGAGLGLAARTAVTPLGRKAVRGAADMVGTGIVKAAEQLPGVARVAGRATGIATPVVTQGAKAAGKMIGQAASSATELAGEAGRQAISKSGQLVKQAGEAGRQAISKSGQLVKRGVDAITDTGQAVRSGGISITPKRGFNIRLTPGSLARGLAGGVAGLGASAVTSPVVRKGLEAVGVENEDVKDVADSIISGGVGAGVGALVAGGSIAGAAAAGAGVPAAAIAGWQAGRQIGNRIGAGDASKTGAYQQTKEKGWWDLAKGAVGMDDESIRQRKLESEGKKVEDRQKEFFANRNQEKQNREAMKNMANFGGIQTGLKDFYTKPR